MHFLETLLKAGADREFSDEPSNPFGFDPFSQRRRMPLGPSSLGKCPRQVAVILARGERKPEPLSRRLMMQAGTEVGAVAERWLERACSSQGGLFIKTQGKVRVPINVPPEQLEKVEQGVSRARRKLPSCMLSMKGQTLSVPGTYDAALYCPSSKHLSMIDVKSGHSFVVKKAKEGNTNDEYWDQLQAYTYAVVDDPDHYIMEGVEIESVSTHLLFIDRSSGEVVPIDGAKWDSLAECQDSLCESVNASASNLLTALSIYGDGTVHDPGVGAAHEANDKGNFPWQCNYCEVGPIVGMCHKGEGEVYSRKKGDAVTWHVR